MLRSNIFAWLLECKSGPESTRFVIVHQQGGSKLIFNSSHHSVCKFMLWVVSMQIPFRSHFGGFVIYEACTVPLQQYYYITGSLEDVRPLICLVPVLPARFQYRSRSTSVIKVFIHLLFLRGHPLVCCPCQVKLFNCSEAN